MVFYTNSAYWWHEELDFPCSGTPSNSSLITVVELRTIIVYIPKEISNNLAVVLYETRSGRSLIKNVNCPSIVPLWIPSHGDITSSNLVLVLFFLSKFFLKNSDWDQKWVSLRFMTTEPDWIGDVYDITWKSFLLYSSPFFNNGNFSVFHFVRINVWLRDARKRTFRHWGNLSDFFQ